MKLVIFSTIFIILAFFLAQKEFMQKASPATASTTSAAVSSTSPAHPSATSSPALAQASPHKSIPKVASTILWGAYAGDEVDSISNFEALVGKKVDLGATFISWDDSFPSLIASPLCSSGKTIVIFWENYNHSLDNIISGQYDSYIRLFSAAVQSYGCPVILSLFHEMNGYWDDWDGTVGDNSSAKIITAWRHVHDLVTAPNVKWAFVVNSNSMPDTPANSIAAYYPGDAYVDYVGVDGFNSGNPWQSFSEIFTSAITQLRRYGKPIYIFSMASAPGSGKAAWISDAIGKQIPALDIAGWIWFNANNGQDWLVTSDTASLAAFKAAVGGK